MGGRGLVVGRGGRRRLLRGCGLVARLGRADRAQLVPRQQIRGARDAQRLDLGVRLVGRDGPEGVGDLAPGLGEVHGRRAQLRLVLVVGLVLQRLGRDGVGVAQVRDREVVFSVEVVGRGGVELDRPVRIVAPLVLARRHARAAAHPRHAEGRGPGRLDHRFASDRRRRASPGQLAGEERPHLVEDQRRVVDDPPVEHQLGQVPPHFPRALVAALHVVLQAALDDADQIPWGVRATVQGRARARGDDGLHRLVVGVAQEGVGAREHLVQHGAEGEEVGPVVQRLPLELLGRHVRVLAADHPGAALADALGVAGHAEVRELHVALDRHQDVRRRDVPVHDLQAPPPLVCSRVGVLQRGGGAGGDVEDRVDRQLTAQLAAGDQELLEVRPVHVLHRDEVLAVVHAEVEDLHDVAVVERDRDPGLVREELRELLQVLERGQDLLEGQPLLEAGRPGEHRQVHLGHAPAREEADEPVATECLACHRILARWTFLEGAPRGPRSGLPPPFGSSQASAPAPSGQSGPVACDPSGGP